MCSTVMQKYNSQIKVIVRVFNQVTPSSFCNLNLKNFHIRILSTHFKDMTELFDMSNLMFSYFCIIQINVIDHIFLIGITKTNASI